MMTNDTISVLIPTRGRPQPLEASVRMLLHLAARPERVEILLRVDEDDPVDYEREIWALFARRGEPSVPGRVVRGPRHGYPNLHLYFNELAAVATGRWCVLWGDDTYMATPRWDAVLDGIPGKLVVAGTEANHGRSPCTFPIFTRTYFEALGHVSLNCHNDTWIEETSKAAGLFVDAPIMVFHAYFPEHLHQKSPRTSEEYGSAEMAAARERDVGLLRTMKGSIR